MKIAIVSDSHDNLANIEKVTAYLDRHPVAMLIHCGDVCAPSTLRVFAESFSKPIHVCFGNVDGDQYLMTKWSYEEFSNVTLHGDIGELEAGRKKIAFVHFPKVAHGLAAEGAYDIVFYGHTHEPWEETVGKTKLVNPGNVANIRNKPSFALYDTDSGKLELVLLDTL
ncbi:MAG: metallophosphoesterase [Patescibacteria group bacterium]